MEPWEKVIYDRLARRFGVEPGVWDDRLEVEQAKAVACTAAGAGFDVLKDDGELYNVVRTPGLTEDELRAALAEEAAKMVARAVAAGAGPVASEEEYEQYRVESLRIINERKPAAEEAPAAPNGWPEKIGSAVGRVLGALLGR